MRMNRRGFLKGAVALGAAGAFPRAVFAAVTDRDWKAAFRSVGFDPDASGAQFVVVTSDVHCANAPHLDEHVALWNALDPKPAAVLALGDLGNANQCFGHRPDGKWNREKMQPAYEEFRTKVVDGLRRDVPLKLLVGNHDTSVLEKDCETFRKYFPEHPLTESFVIGDVLFIKLNGGVDAILDEVQRRWFVETARTWPKEKTLVVLVHQPSVGMTARERDIGIYAKIALAERTGETWLWGGHEHRNEFRVFDLPHTRLWVATHPQDREGFWLYGLKDGKVAARVWWRTGDVPRGVAPFESAKACGEIPVPFQDVEKDILWRTFVGDSAERAARREFSGADNRGWFFYLKNAVYEFPKPEVAPKATRLAVLGVFHGLRKDKSRHETFSFSPDGATWRPVTRTGGIGDTWIFEIPAEMRDGNIWFRIDAFGMGCDDALSGFAFLV